MTPLEYHVSKINEVKRLISNTTSTKRKTDLKKNLDKLMKEMKNYKMFKKKKEKEGQ